MKIEVESDSKTAYLSFHKPDGTVALATITPYVERNESDGRTIERCAVEIVNSPPRRGSTDWTVSAYEVPS